jgi:hypothetical protein
MTLALHICTGLGLAFAAGLRPFLPALLAGALARADVLADFHRTHFAFLQSPLFLLAVAVLLVAAYLLASRRFGELLGGASVLIGGLLFGGVLAAHHEASWPGILAGVLAASAAYLATRPLLDGARARLDDGAARTAVALYADGAALLAAALAWFAPPVALVFAALLARLLWGQRRDARSRFAGLRVLR